MKLVINKCYGGFSLSAKAISRWAEIKGEPCFFFKNTFEHGKSKYIPVSQEEASKNMFWVAFKVEEPPVENLENWHEMTMEERKEYNQRYDALCWNNRPEDRSDPTLIQIVEELGEEANGACASLQIVKIPDGVKWIIEEYDGQEWISEEHRTWS